MFEHIKIILRKEKKVIRVKQINFQFRNQTTPDMQNVCVT